MCASGIENWCAKCRQYCTDSLDGQYVWSLGVNYGDWWCNKCKPQPPNHPASPLANPPDDKKDEEFDEKKDPPPHWPDTLHDQLAQDLVSLI